MFKSISIQNLQSHKNTSLEFSDGVNVIIGESDSGKTAILRALMLVAENRPLGDGICSEWGGETKVALVTEENNIIQRIKSKTKNTYWVNDKELTAFGHNPPEEVLDTLNLDTTNIQRQNEPPFILSLNPGDLAKLLNQAASITDIDIAAKQIKSWRTSAKAEKEQAERTIATKTEELTQYEKLEEIEGRLVAAEGLEKQCSQIAQSITKIEECLETISEVEEVLKKKPLLKRAGFELAKALVLKESIERLETEIENLEEAIDRNDRAVHLKESAEKRLVKVKAEYEKALPKGCPLLPDECPLLRD